MVVVPPNLGLQTVIWQVEDTQKLKSGIKRKTTKQVTVAGLIAMVGMVAAAYIAYQWYYWVGQFWADDHVGEKWNTRAMFDYVQRRVNMMADWIEGLVPDLPSGFWSG